MKKTSITLFTFLFITSVISCNTKIYPVYTDNNTKSLAKTDSVVTPSSTAQIKSSPVVTSSPTNKATADSSASPVIITTPSPVEETPIIKTEKASTNELEIAYKYAPIIFQETNKKSQSPRFDFITSFDFDNDLQCNNNEQSLKNLKIALPSVVYYSFVETGTHYFIEYSFYHALDWSEYPSFIPYNWHENDMENIQIVVRKKSDKLEEDVVILSTQAHLSTEVSVPEKTNISSSSQTLASEKIRLLNTDVKFSGTHCAVYVETGGHGIHNMNAQQDRFSQLEPPKLKEGFMLTPIQSYKTSPDYYKDDKSDFQYQLRPVYETFWKYYKNNENIGDGKVLDGSFSYKDELVEHKNLPRFFDSDRMSGPGKYDAGIVPFAFSFTLSSSDLGVIFFNPAKKYAETLKINEPWSRIYVYNPYLK